MIGKGRGDVDVREDQDEGVGALVTRLAADGRAYAQAEIGYWQALAADRLADAKNLAVLGVGALLLVNAAVIALIVGLLLSLQTLVGPGLATLIVVLLTLAVAGLLGWLALKRLGRVTRSRQVP